MNAFSRPISGNGYGLDAIRTDRDNEYAVFSRVTHMLREAQNNGDDRAAISAAAKNNDLWTILLADLSHPENALPNETKDGLVSLAAFSIKQGFAVMQGKATVAPLIDINMSMMKGLRGEATT